MRRPQRGMLVLVVYGFPSLPCLQPVCIDVILKTYPLHRDDVDSSLPYYVEFILQKLF